MEKKKIKTKLKVNDVVKIISGKDRGKKGKVLSIDLLKERVVVEGVNKVQKTIKKTQENQTGGFITQELPVHISNVMYFDNDADKRVRLGIKRLDGKKFERYSRVDGRGGNKGK